MRVAIRSFSFFSKRRSSADSLLLFLISRSLGWIFPYKNLCADCMKKYNAEAIEELDESKMRSNIDTHAEEIKFCRKCGNKLLEDSKFCDKCGTEVVK